MLLTQPITPNCHGGGIWKEVQEVQNYKTETICFWKFLKNEHFCEKCEFWDLHDDPEIRNRSEDDEGKTGDI